MEERIVSSQTELDEIPADFDGRIIVKFGTQRYRALIRKQYRYSVVVRDNSSVEAWGNSSVEARDNSSVEAWGNSSVEARGNSSVEARGNSSVEAWGNSSVAAGDNSSVAAWDNSHVAARGNSHVVAWGNSQIVNRKLNGENLVVNGNARIVYDPRNIDEFIATHGLESDNETVKLYKAVRKNDGKYLSDYDKHFEYVIGREAIANGLDTNVENDCGEGIHMSDKAWCVNYARDWDNMAILELEVEKAGVVVPLYGVGKVRALKATPIREVPLEECGLLGKILAKRRATE